MAGQREEDEHLSLFVSGSSMFLSFSVLSLYQIMGPLILVLTGGTQVTMGRGPQNHSNNVQPKRFSNPIIFGFNQQPVIQKSISHPSKFRLA
uniref:Uncharacterized protein n=1 Tax=Arundo donax TaxID=35708 RepID=A0A0A9BE02_ARUDO